MALKEKPRALNAAGLALIQYFESCRLRAYRDETGIWTIGWGHTGSEVTPVTEITQQVADFWLGADIDDACACVESHVNVDLTDNQFAALVSFAFNVGRGNPAAGKSGFVRLRNGKPSSMLRALNRGDYKAAALEFPKWNHASGAPSKGLTKRRLAEQELFRLS